LASDLSNMRELRAHGERRRFLSVLHGLCGYSSICEILQSKKRAAEQPPAPVARVERELAETGVELRPLLIPQGFQGLDLGGLAGGAKGRQQRDGNKYRRHSDQRHRIRRLDAIEERL